MHNRCELGANGAMRNRQSRRICLIGLLLLAVAAWTAACSSVQSTPTPSAGSSDETYTSAHLNTDYDAAISVSGQLALGTMKLEGTASAVSADQASALLPLWQALRGEALQNQDEVNAVLKQIEGMMNAEQLEAIAAMQLTQDDLRTWAESQGLIMRFGPGEGQPGQGGQFSVEASPTGQAPPGGPGATPQARPTGQAPFGGEGPAPEAMETMRAQFENMTDEQRAALRATAEAGGGGFRTRTGTRGGLGGLGEVAVVFDPLIELLTARAAQ